MPRICRRTLPDGCSLDLVCDTNNCRLVTVNLKVKTVLRKRKRPAETVDTPTQCQRAAAAAVAITSPRCQRRTRWRQPKRVKELVRFQERLKLALELWAQQARLGQAGEGEGGRGALALSI